MEITFSDKSDINVSTIPIQNKITSADMNEIKSVVNTNDGIVGNLVNLTTLDKTSIVNSINSLLSQTIGNNTYTLDTEIDTGKKWTNGNKIYRKVIKTNGTLGTDLQIAHNVANIDTPTSYKMISTYNGTTYFQDYTSTGQYGTLLNPKKIDSTYLYCDIGGGFNNWDIYHIFEYTKIGG